MKVWFGRCQVAPHNKPDNSGMREEEREEAGREGPVQALRKEKDSKYKEC